MKTQALIIFTMLLIMYGECKSYKKKTTKSRKLEPISEEMMASYGAMIAKMQNDSIGKPDPKVGAMVSAMKPGDRPEEMGTYMEGDILTVKVQSDQVAGNVNFRWPNGVVPYYVFASRFHQQHLNRINHAMQYIQKFTCIRFKPWTTGTRDYIYIQSNPTGCWSSVGRTGEGQILNLGPGCLEDVGTPIHELMHALGINHEQSRNDRDNYVTIQWNNIQNGQAHNFQKDPLFKGLGVAYDYSSVMHYSSTAFTRNRLPTIVPKRRVSQLGQRKGLTQQDVDKINLLYNCKVGKSG